jgi:hypothetical protein
LTLIVGSSKAGNSLNYFLVTVFSTTSRNNEVAQFKLSTPLIHTRRTEVWAMMASHFLSETS